MRPGISLGARIWAPIFNITYTLVSEGVVYCGGITPVSATVTVCILAFTREGDYSIATQWSFSSLKNALFKKIGLE